MRSRDHLTAVALTLAVLAVAVRLISVALLWREPQGLHDPSIYLAAARSIAEGRGYTSMFGQPTAYYPPGYPYFLGLVLWLLERVGAGAWLLPTVGVLQSVFGGVATAATVVAGARIADRRTGILAGLLVALWPNLILHAPLVLSESLFLAAFTVALATLTVLTAANTPSRAGRSLLLAAVVIGTLVRPQSLVPAAAASCAALALTGIGRRRVAGSAAILVGGVFLAVVPWTIRNAFEMGAFVPLTTSTGDNLCIGFHSGATGAFAYAPDCATSYAYVLGPEAEVGRDLELRRRTMAWIRSHPAELPALSVKKLRSTFARDIDGAYALEGYGQDLRFTLGERAVLHHVSDIYYGIVAVLALAGGAIVLLLSWKRRRMDTGPALLLAFLSTGVVAPVLFFGDYRFKVPVVPCLAILAAWAVTTGIGRLREIRRS